TTGAAHAIERAPRVGDRERRFTIKPQDRSDLPAADQAIQPGTGLAAETLASSKRQFVNCVEIENMSRVLISNGVLGRGIGVIDQRLEAGLTGAGRVGQEFLEGVVRLQRETVAEATTDLHLQGVVARLRRVG